MIKFDQDDLCKRVLLILDPNKLKEDTSTEDGFRQIPYQAIKKYQVIPMIRDTSKPAPKIIDSGPCQPKVNIVSIARRMEIGEIRTIGDIVEVTEDYLKIKVVEDKRAPWYQSKDRYGLE